ncbi:MAG: hypothetical protein ABL921_14185 [Pirellula sp.]
MNIRRPLFVATLVIGGGILAFQPLMRRRIESRLSDLFGARVEVGHSKISLIDGVISLRNVVLHPTNEAGGTVGGATKTPTVIAHAALKFDWSAAVYRNLLVDQLLVTGAQWTLATPSNREIPIAFSEDSQVALAKLASKPEIPQSQLGLEQVVQPIKQKLQDESKQQGQIQADITNRINLLYTRLQEALPSGSNPNPLRQQLVVDEAKREMAMIRQALAEDRIRRRDADKILSQLKQETPQRLEKQLFTHFDTEVANIHEAALALAKSAVARNWNLYRPVVISARNSMYLLASGDHEGLAERSKFHETDHSPIAGLPQRFTTIASARIRGEVALGNDSLFGKNSKQEFELRLKDITSSSSAEGSNPRVALCFVQSNDNSSNQVVCAVDRVANGASGTTQIQISLERKTSSGTIESAKILQANHGWSSTVQFPIEDCLKEIKADQAMTVWSNAVPGKSSQVLARLVGTTPRQDDQLSEMGIEVEPTSVAPLETILSKMIEKRSALQKSELEARGSEFVNSHLIKIQSQWEQSGDVHVKTHTTWEAQLAQLNELVQQFDSSDRRTSRRLDPSNR